jgi:hypothetical protein
MHSANLTLRGGGNGSRSGFGFFGGQCRARTCDLTLVRNAINSNKDFIPTATVCDGLSRNALKNWPHAVSLKVTPCLHIECKFWFGDDGWNGSGEPPSIFVQAPSFEKAKADMELALAQHPELLLSTEKQARGRAA